MQKEDVGLRKAAPCGERACSSAYAGHATGSAARNGVLGAISVQGAGDEAAAHRVPMREAGELLARGWPEGYPAGAVEWLVFNRSKTSKSNGKKSVHPTRKDTHV
ncbi:hypothetical protein PQQ73_08475 [Paraburkholderia strydomiana]|uniref:Uncharacterized protein n=1 Tax=Paraburkholderia strydomiana TaxID=1245417 RepID=A0ABW9EA04_9BURK